ncbi:hypothetical protein SCHPADRAFT_945751 [Schizopora paradoxa]|uniref:DUF6818 domain-containing protein n=1 Tax=Schizopora paradoxa TaxID=27342 RepID=A0A0H2R4T4_9AGAM|nr:hypothetical protein SCHPADRAFT_945751 [Schizopora paradoxa]
MDNCPPEDRDWHRPPVDPKDPRLQETFGWSASSQFPDRSSGFAGSNSYAASQAMDAANGQRTDFQFPQMNSTPSVHQDLLEYQESTRRPPVAYSFPPTPSPAHPYLPHSYPQSSTSHFDAGRHHHPLHSTFTNTPSSHHPSSISEPSSLRDAAMSSDDDLDDQLKERLSGMKKRKGKGKEKVDDGSSQVKKAKGDAEAGPSGERKRGRVRKPTEKAKDAEAEKQAKGQGKRKAKRDGDDGDGDVDMPGLLDVSDSEPWDDDDDNYNYDSDDDDFFGESGGKGKDKADASKSKGKAKAKDKGKGKAVGDAPDEETKSKGKTVKVKEEPKATKGGRKPGAKNFGHEDTKRLLDLVRQELPLGQNGWNHVADLFNVWAGANSFSDRNPMALRKRFQSLVNQTKPTGQPEMLECVALAKDIDQEIRAQVETIDLDDDDWNEAYDSGIEIVEPKTSKKNETKTSSASGPAFKREPKEKVEKKPRRGVEDILSGLQQSLDPAARAQRDEARIGNQFLLARIAALEAETREKDSRIEHLQAELRESERQRNSAERERDNARSELRMAEFMQQVRGTLNVTPFASFGASSASINDRASGFDASNIRHFGGSNVASSSHGSSRGGSGSGGSNAGAGSSGSSQPCDIESEQSKARNEDEETEN